MCSVYEEARRAKLAPFAAAGFAAVAVVLVLPDQSLFGRQAEQYAAEGKCVDEITMAQMRGATIPWTLVLNGAHTVGEVNGFRGSLCTPGCFRVRRAASVPSVQITFSNFWAALRSGSLLSGRRAVVVCCPRSAWPHGTNSAWSRSCHCFRLP